MIYVYHCKTCNESTIPHGQASCTIKFSVSKSCEHCHKMDTRDYTLFFCSAKCMMKWMWGKGDVLLRNVGRFEKNESFPWRFTEVDENNVIRSYIEEEESEFKEEPPPCCAPQSEEK